MRLLANCVAVALLITLLILAGCGSQKSELAPGHDLTLAEAQAQLSQLPVPSGISATDFDALRQAFAAQLAASGADKWVAAAPSDAKNQVGDLSLSKIDDVSAQAQWSYRNVGDYDQNSQANISDLTPLGANLGENSSGAKWPTAQLADGDGNNEVNISDITPLGAHLQNSVDGYIIQATTTPEVESSWLPAGIAQFGDSTQASPGARRQFSATVPAVSGQSFRVVPFFAAANGIPGLPYAYTGQSGGGSLSFEERQIILNQIADKLDNLTATTSDGQDAELADYIATLPHIEEAGYFEGNAWGRFDDELVAIVCKNHAPASGQQVSSLREALGAGPHGGSTRSASGWGLPADNGGNLLWGYGGGTFYTDPVYDLSGILDAAGYDTYAGAADIAALRNIVGDGLLYLDSPAGSARARDGSVQYWIGLDEDLSNASEISLTEDINAKRVGYMFAMDGSGSGKWKYCFGAKFVEHYMTFSANSIVFLNTPLSGMAAEMIDEFHFAGASLVLGWTANLPNDITYAGALHLIDRVLGANEFGRLEDPPIRPFNLQETLFDMQARGVSAGQPIYYPLAPGNPYDSLMRFYSTYNPFDSFNLFVPSIEHMAVNISADGSGNVLELYGDFGDNFLYEPSILVDNQGLEIVSYDPGQLVGKLPDSGMGSYGDVEALVNGILSNIRQLTEWRGTMTYTAVGPGTLTHTLSYDLHFRADINSYRALPDTLPLLLGEAGSGIVGLVSAPDSFATVRSSGSYTDPGNTTTTWTNAGNTHVNNVYGAAGGDNLFLGGNFDLNAQKMSFILPTIAPFHEKEVNSEGIVDHDEDRSFYTDAALAVSLSGAPLEMQLAPSSAILAGSFDKQTGDVHYSLSWELIPAFYEPDPNAPR